MKVAILVVVYNSSATNSLTLQSLISCQRAFPESNLTLAVWNNGPSSIRSDILNLIELAENIGMPVTFQEDLSNVALSTIYNNFIEAFTADRYVIWDHDSKISAEYYRQIFSVSADLLMPGIVVDGKIESPSIRGVGITEGAIADATQVLAIGSGLCLSAHLCQVLRNATGSVFDESYALYGVDTSLFLKIRKIAAFDKLTFHRGAEMAHSLSRLEKESANTTTFRALERAYERGITMRRYPTWSQFKNFIKLTAFAIIGVDRKVWINIFSGFSRGRHPRSKWRVLSAGKMMVRQDESGPRH